MSAMSAKKDRVGKGRFLRESVSDGMQSIEPILWWSEGSWEDEQAPIANYILLSTIAINNLSYANNIPPTPPNPIDHSHANSTNIIEIITSRKLPYCRYRKYCPQQSSHILPLPNQSPNYFLSAIPCRFDNLSPSLRGPGRLCIHRKCPRRSIGDCSPKLPQKEGRRRVHRLWRCSCLLIWVWMMRVWKVRLRSCKVRLLMCSSRCKDTKILRWLRSFGCK